MPLLTKFFYLMIIISYIFLIFICVAGLLGLFLFDSYVKKISALSVCFGTLIILLGLIVYNEANIFIDDLVHKKMITFFISLLLIFSINLMIALGIIKNIGEVSIKD